VESGNGGKCPRSRRLPWLLDVAAAQDVNRPRRMGDDGVNRGRLDAGAGPVAAVHSGEYGLETVVVALRNRVELVVVAAGAVGGEAGERGHGVAQHVVAVEQSGS